jgi:hypothetical protein
MRTRRTQSHGGKERYLQGKLVSLVNDFQVRPQSSRSVTRTFWQKPKRAFATGRSLPIFDPEKLSVPVHNRLRKCKKKTGDGLRTILIASRMARFFAAAYKTNSPI